MSVHRDNPTEADLRTLVEPLASYLCGTNTPKTNLLWALTILLQEIRRFNGETQGYLSSTACSGNVPPFRAIRMGDQEAVKDTPIVRQSAEITSGFSKCQ
jgi:hypothetical protein